MRWLAPAVVLTIAGACASASSKPIVACSPSAAPQKPPPPAVPDSQKDLFNQLTADAEAFAFQNGSWVESLGDASFYGLGFYARAGKAMSNAGWSERAQAARTRAVGVVANADFATGDLQDIVMSGLGLIDAIASTGDANGATNPDRATLDTFVNRLDTIVGLVGFYLDAFAEKSWAIKTYGPTAVSALVGLVSAQHAYLLGGDGKDDRVAWAKTMRDKIAAKAWNGSYYLFGTSRDDVDLYANVAMIALESRLFQLTNDAQYKNRALALYKAIQPLKLPDGRYYSAYSAAAFGAKSNDFSTLSSQSYAVLSLLLLYEITGDAKYVTEADRVVEAVKSTMLGTWCHGQVHNQACTTTCTAPQICIAAECANDACGGGLLHHWIDGRIAQPSDPTFFCSGCNLQMLYVLWYRSRML